MRRASRRSTPQAPRRIAITICAAPISAARWTTTDSARRLTAFADAAAHEPDVVFVAADGLSAFAATRHAVPFLTLLRPRLEGWKIAPVVIATQARVALGDGIGERLKAKIVVVMIGERPGLSSPDSLGLYVTYAPRAGRHDAEHNCISNVRPEGLSYEAAAFKLHWLLDEARRVKLTGVGLKDLSDDLLETRKTPPLAR